VFQGGIIDQVMRLMAAGIEVQKPDGRFVRFIENDHGDQKSTSVGAHAPSPRPETDQLLPFFSSIAPLLALGARRPSGPILWQKSGPGILSLRNRDDLKLNQVGPFTGPTLQKRNVVAFCDLKAAAKSSPEVLLALFPIPPFGSSLLRSRNGEADDSGLPDIGGSDLWCGQHVSISQTLGVPRLRAKLHAAPHSKPPTADPAWTR
jgi:hypothetical protein